MARSVKDWLKTFLVILAFCAAFCFGALKSLIFGPIASLVLILGNLGVIIGLFPAHVAWTVYALLKTDKFDAPLKIAILLVLPALFCLWLGLSTVATVLGGLGYGFFSPWVASFEAFRLDDHDSKKCVHCVLDGTWGTIKGCCTVVRDFADVCYHSYPLYLKELRENPSSCQLKPLRLIHIPACIFVGVLGLIVEIPLYTIIAIVKSPYMLFKGWQRLLHDLVSREGPFLETACIPIAGLTILIWPLFVVGSIVMAVFSSIFIGLYGSVVVYQERSFRRGIAFVVAMVAEFDEYTNDWLYLREGSFLPKPQYRKKILSNPPEISVPRIQSLRSSVATEAPAILAPSLTSSRSVRETMKEVKMVQVWESMMKSAEMKGKELLDLGVITPSDLSEWLKTKNSPDATIVDEGLPCLAFLHTFIHSIKVGSNGIMFMDGTEINHLNRPQDRLLDWFFHPIMVLKDQIRAINLEESEIRYLEKLVLFGQGDRFKTWENGSEIPKDSLRSAQLEGICRRMMGIVRSTSKLPTYRRRYKQVVKAWVTYSMAKEETDSKAINSNSNSNSKQGSNRTVSFSAPKEDSISSLEIV